ncbi:MAG: ABC transporter permease subunit [Spirochaetales bacterium]|nr:ABC transporter permease subunit [Spirochaetales bacterium]
MQESELTFEQTASYYIENNKEAFTSYLGEEKAKLLYQEGSGNTKVELFPFTLSIKTNNIDKAVRSFATNSKAVLSGIQNTLNGFVVGAYNLFKFIPWYVFLALVFLLSFLGKRKLLTAFFLTSLIFVVGLLGLYEEMLLTLSIALTSVIISLVLGLPLGILIANSSTANKIVQPVLDTMQTMPVFVYLIPALLLFGMGNAASVIATVIYAIVPIVRLTSLGIRNVDKEIIESGKAFGSTSWQILTKIQIPQALPTIATGINQTLMMAMAMVVTCSMIGARGLGLEVLNSVNRIEIGNGLVAGTCVVILAIVLDRITMGYVKKDKIKND